MFGNHRLTWKFGSISSTRASIEKLSNVLKTVSADPIYRQMERLESLRKGHETALLTLTQNDGVDTSRIVGLDTFENFAIHYRNFVLKAASIPEQKQMVQKFIRKVEQGVDSVKVHYIVDQDWNTREHASIEAGSRPLRGRSENFVDLGSNTLTIGGPTPTRTGIRALGKTRLIQKKEIYAPPLR